MEIFILFPLALLALAAYSQNIIQTQWPNLIIPVDNSKDDTALGTQYSGTILFFPGPNDGDQIHTEIVFDNIPNIGASQCRLNFDLSPTGPSKIDVRQGGYITFDIFNLVGSFVDVSDTWEKRPQVGHQVATVTIRNGVASITPNSFPCAVGKAQFILSPGNMLFGGYSFTWFELNDPANHIKNGITYEMLQ